MSGAYVVADQKMGRPRKVNPDGTKQCSRCRKTKPICDFSQRPDAPTTQPHCKACNAEKVKLWRQNNPEKARALRAATNKRYRFLRFGITQEIYEQQWQTQAGLCAICGDSLYEGSGGAAIDHDHVTGVFRGILCGLCNTGLGQFRDSAKRLLAASAYLNGDGVVANN